MYDAKADARATLWILHYVTTTEGKEKARTVIYEWLRHIQLREVRAMLLQYVDSIDTSVFDEQTTKPIGEDEPQQNTSSQGLEFLLKLASSINTPLQGPLGGVETDTSMDEDVTTPSMQRMGEYIHQKMELSVTQETHP